MHAAASAAWKLAASPVPRSTTPEGPPPEVLLVIKDWQNSMGRTQQRLQVASMLAASGRQETHAQGGGDVDDPMEPAEQPDADGGDDGPDAESDLSYECTTPSRDGDDDGGDESDPDDDGSGDWTWPEGTPLLRVRFIDSTMGGVGPVLAIMRLRVPAKGTAGQLLRLVKHQLQKGAAQRTGAQAYQTGTADRRSRLSNYGCCIPASLGPTSY